MKGLPSWHVSCCTIEKTLLQLGVSQDPSDALAMYGDCTKKICFSGLLCIRICLKSSDCWPGKMAGKYRSDGLPSSQHLLRHCQAGMYWVHIGFSMKSVKPRPAGASFGRGQPLSSSFTVPHQERMRTYIRFEWGMCQARRLAVYLTQGKWELTWERCAAGTQGNSEIKARVTKRRISPTHRARRGSRRYVAGCANHNRL